MIEKYYSAEQQARLVARREVLGAERIAEVEAEWPRLIAAVREALAQGVDPRSPEGRALATRWTALVGEFTGGDPELATAARRMVAAEPTVSAQLGLAFLPLPVRGPSDFPGAVQAATREGAEALVVFDDTALTQHRAPLLRLAAQHALPVASIYKDFAAAGGLLAYGPSLPALYRRRGLLRGQNPARREAE